MTLQLIGLSVMGMEELYSIVPIMLIGLMEVVLHKHLKEEQHIRYMHEQTLQ